MLKSRLWSDALVAWLHDPPDKALSIVDHVSRARRYASAALGDAVTESDMQILSDSLASASERLPMPDARGDSCAAALRIVCRIPAGIWRLWIGRRALRRSQPVRLPSRAPKCTAPRASELRCSRIALRRHARRSTCFVCAHWPCVRAARAARRAQRDRFHAVIALHRVARVQIVIVTPIWLATMSAFGRKGALAGPRAQAKRPSADFLHGDEPRLSYRHLGRRRGRH